MTTSEGEVLAIVAPDGVIHPRLYDAMIRSLRPIFADVQGETVRNVYADQPFPVVRLATVVATDPDEGTVEVIVDGDGDPTPERPPTAPATCVGPVPPPDSRAVVIFIPGGSLYCLGQVGAAQIVVPDGSGVSVTGDGQPVQVGSGDGPNLAIGGYAIQARDGIGDRAEPSDLALNAEGGLVTVGPTVAIGRHPDTTTGAVIAHRDHMTAAAAGFRQQADGDVVLNAPTGHAIEIRVNGDATSLETIQEALGGGTYHRVPAGLPTTAGGGVGVVYDPADRSLRLATSSGRYKTGVAALVRSRAAAVIAALRPVSYRRSDVPSRDGDPEPGTITEVGFVAEDVAQVAPLAVVSDEDGPLAVRTDVVVAYLVAAVQDLTARLDALTDGR